jgi:hypothetical protein
MLIGVCISNQMLVFSGCCSFVAQDCVLGAADYAAKTRLPSCDIPDSVKSVDHLPSLRDDRGYTYMIDPVVPESVEIWIW